MGHHCKHTKGGLCKCKCNTLFKGAYNPRTLDLYSHTIALPVDAPTMAPTSHPTAFDFGAAMDGTCYSTAAYPADLGYGNRERGWYDVQGCGKCYSYCRWVGNSPLYWRCSTDAPWDPVAQWNGPGRYNSVNHQSFPSCGYNGRGNTV
jgi:hypothetical protein